MSFPLAQQFSALSGQSGLAEFYNSGGTFSLIALRTDSTGAVAASPVYSQTGSPILVSGGSSGGGSLPSFSSILVTGTFSPSGQPTYQIRITIGSLSPTTTLTTVVAVGAYVTPGYTAASFNATFNNFTFDGQAFTFGGYSPGNGGSMADSKLTMYGITAASLSLTLASPQIGTTGNLTGNLSMTSSLTTLSGPFSGTYILNP